MNICNTPHTTNQTKEANDTTFTLRPKGSLRTRVLKVLSLRVQKPQESGTPMSKDWRRWMSHHKVRKRDHLSLLFFLVGHSAEWVLPSGNFNLYKMSSDKQRTLSVDLEKIELKELSSVLGLKV
jgi:hypothetical protein